MVLEELWTDARVILSGTSVQDHLKILVAGYAKKFAITNWSKIDTPSKHLWDKAKKMTLSYEDTIEERLKMHGKLKTSPETLTKEMVKKCWSNSQMETKLKVVRGSPQLEFSFGFSEFFDCILKVTFCYK